AGETANEVQKKYLKELEDSISSTRKKGIRGRIYIQVVETPVKEYSHGVKWTFFIRESPCDMMYSTTLYYHDEGDEQPGLVWAVPEQTHCDHLLSHPNQTTPRHLFWIKKCIAFMNEKAKQHESKIILATKQRKPGALILPPGYT
ncbi:MAG: RING finger protein, partial [Rhodanobacter sp.]